jgi:glutaredoxin
MRRLAVWRWLRGKWQAPPRSLPVVLYTRQGCHLCEEALALLHRYAKTYQLLIEEIDIDGDPRLAAEYGEKVPVIVINGRPRLWGRPNEVLLRRLLRGREL